MSTRARLKTLEGKQRLTERIVTAKAADVNTFAHMVGRDIRELRAKVDELTPKPLPEDPEIALTVACDERRVVTFKYRDRDGETSWRVVSPYELRIINGIGSLSLQCYDHGREGLRHFRVERIEGAVTVTNVAEYRPAQAS